jgi:hypothetical protein
MCLGSTPLQRNVHLVSIGCKRLKKINRCTNYIFYIDLVLILPFKFRSLSASFLDNDAPASWQQPARLQCQPGRPHCKSSTASKHTSQTETRDMKFWNYIMRIVRNNSTRLVAKILLSVDKGAKLLEACLKVMVESIK